MVRRTNKNTPQRNSKGLSVPPGKVKIANAIRLLLKEKEFNAITTAEIAKVSGVNEALIYRYFKDKRGLLHQILAEDLIDLQSQMKVDLKGVKGAVNKLRKLFWSHINYYDKNRVFAKILLLEVRNYPGYFKSETYQLVKSYGQIVLEIIEEGIKSGEIRDDISPSHIRQVILGGIEHLCLPGVIFGREISPDLSAENLYKIIFEGIAKRKA